MTAPTSPTSPTELTSLAELTTLRVGGPAARVLTARSTEDLVSAVRAADAEGAPVLLVAGGSNLVVADTAFEGTVVRVLTRGVHEESHDRCGGAVVRVAAGEPWDPFVAHTVARGLIGLEALRGIPGSVGATPVQNVGAYGQEVAAGIARVRTWDRAAGCITSFAGAECGFGYRDSLFKQARHVGPGGLLGPRYVVLEVTFQLVVADLAEPVRYAELARALGVEPGARVPAAELSAAVLNLRRGKGMVLDENDRDTWSAGSFFTNPVLAHVPPDVPEAAPRWSGAEGTKLSAAWLIEQAGFGRGYGLPGPAALSTKHTLAITNRGAATAADVMRLARLVRDGVRERFGVTLVPEPELIGLTL